MVGYVSSGDNTPYVNYDGKCKFWDNLSAEHGAIRIKKYCRSRGLKLTKIYKDYGWPGMSLKDPGIKELRKDVSKGKISKIVYINIRDTRQGVNEGYVLKRIFKKYKVKIINLSAFDLIYFRFQEKYFEI